MRSVAFGLVTTTLIGATLGGGVSIAHSAELIAPPSLNETQVDLRFRRLDKDNDTQLTHSETRAYPILTSQFGDLDLDRDGRLSVAEFSGVLAHPARLGEIFSF